MDNVFINISNHPSSDWNEKQLAAAKLYGSIIDIPFPSIDPNSGIDEITSLAESYYQKIMTYSNAVVMVQGEFTFSYSLIKRLRKAGLKVLASCSIRRSDETLNADGTVVKKSIFEFDNFREYE
ncbi:MAG: hypothetical protein K6G26_11050 [Lachnospiraceae bacterium]|nr:hypothetical protein [Lachnospiraceae bacterium]